MMTLDDIDRTRIVFLRTKKNLAVAGYENGWLEFFESSKFVGSIKTRSSFFADLAIDFFNNKLKEITDEHAK